MAATLPQYENLPILSEVLMTGVIHLQNLLKVEVRYCKVGNEQIRLEIDV